MPPGAGAVSLFCFPHGSPDCLVMKLFCTLSPNEWFILCKVEQIEQERPRQPDPRLTAWQVNTWQTLAHVLSRWRQRGDPALAQPHLVPDWQLSSYAGRLINLNLVITCFYLFFFLLLLRQNWKRWPNVKNSCRKIRNHPFAWFFSWWTHHSYELKKITDAYLDYSVVGLRKKNWTLITPCQIRQ